MNYSHLYSKLKNELYTTIRKNKPAEIGDVVEEYYTGGREPLLLHKAQVIAIDRVKLSQLPTSVLIMDCFYEGSNIRSRFDCYELFQSFQPTTVRFSTQTFHLILLKKVNYQK